MIAQLDPLYIKTRPAKAVSRLASHIFFQGRPLTTRGRWMNHILAVVLKSARMGPQLKRVDRPIFILGMGRSGTTILGKVLSMHRDVGFLNEPKLLWHIAYPEDDLIGSYTRGKAHYRLGAEQVTERVRETCHRLYGFYLASVGSRRVLDKYPEMIFRLPFIRAIFPDAKFLFLVRSGWDVARSVAFWSRQNEVVATGEVHNWWGVDNRKWSLLVEQIVTSDPAFAESTEEVASLSQQEDMAAVEWIATMREGLRLIDETHHQIHCVRYEDLVMYPQETLSRITEFCELPPDDVFTTYGGNVLKPRRSQDPVALHPSIQPLFEETMGSLGYAL